MRRWNRRTLIGWPGLILAGCFFAGAVFNGSLVLVKSQQWQNALGAAILVEPGNPNQIGPPLRFRPTTALALLSSLAVKAPTPRSGYQREKFGTAWSDVDGNGCDTRNDVLRRDLQDVVLMPGSSCVIAAGVLADPYTGQEIAFRRGRDTSAAVQIDHVVALSDAWQKGAQALPAEQRLAFANDPLNLIAVDGPANGRKSDSDAQNWLPPNNVYRCGYVARQISVKAAYRLWVTAGEKRAMEQVLSGCLQEQSQGSGL